MLVRTWDQSRVGDNYPSLARNAVGLCIVVIIPIGYSAKLSVDTFW